MMHRRIVRRGFVFLLAGLMVSSRGGWGASVKPGAFDVRETTIAETQAAIRAGEVTCRELVEAYRKRVLAYDQSTHLNSMILLNLERDDDRGDAGRDSRGGGDVSRAGGGLPEAGAGV